MNVTIRNTLTQEGVRLIRPTIPMRNAINNHESGNHLRSRLRTTGLSSTETFYLHRRYSLKKDILERVIYGEKYDEENEVDGVQELRLYDHGHDAGVS